jgi:hypothetical protein
MELEFHCCVPILVQIRPIRDLHIHVFTMFLMLYSPLRPGLLWVVSFFQF